MHSNSGSDEVGSDWCLKIGKGEDEVRLKCENFWDVCRGEGRDTRLLAPHLRRAHRIPGDADDAILLAKKVQRLDCFFRQADDARGVETCAWCVLSSVNGGACKLPNPQGSVS